jgi:hypothetical protein
MLWAATPQDTSQSSIWWSQSLPSLIYRSPLSVPSSSFPLPVLCAQDAMSNAESYIKFVVKAVLESCPEDINFFTKHYDSTLFTRLTKLIEDPFVRIPYREAVSLLEVSLSILSLSALSLSPRLSHLSCPSPPSERDQEISVPLEISTGTLWNR